MTDLHELLRHGFDDFRQFVNPLIAQRVELAGEPWDIVRIRDGLLVDRDGREYEDFHGTQSLGHRRKEIGDALKAFLDSDAPNWFPGRVNPFAGRLARVLCERAGYERAYLASSGAEAVEAALKLARGATRRPRILSMDGAYHGCTFGAVALMNPGIFREPFAPHLPGVESLPFDDVAALERAFADGGIAALVVEPIQVEGGVRALSPRFLERACALTAESGALLIADEVQTGLGRTGHLLLSSTWPRKPDVVVLGKALGGGMVAASAMLTRRELFDRAYGSDFALAEAHNVTFSGYGLMATGALAMLDLVTHEVMREAAAKGARVLERMRRELPRFPLVREVRGNGLIWGLELVPSDHPWLQFENLGLKELTGRPTTGLMLAHRMYRRGYYCFVCGHDWRTLRLQPRLDIPESKLHQFVDALAQELEALCQVL